MKADFAFGALEAAFTLYPIELFAVTFTGEKMGCTALLETVGRAAATDTLAKGAPGRRPARTGAAIGHSMRDSAAPRERESLRGLPRWRTADVKRARDRTGG